MTPPYNDIEIDWEKQPRWIRRDTDETYVCIQDVVSDLQDAVLRFSSMGAMKYAQEITVFSTLHTFMESLLRLSEGKYPGGLADGD